jgi:ATP-binding protein involved in chromosome partitioning
VDADVSSFFHQETRCMGIRSGLNSCAMNSAQTEAALQAWLQSQSSAASKNLAQMTTDGDALRVNLGFAAASQHGSLQAALQAAAPGARIEIGLDVTAHSVQRGLKPLPGAKNVIAVASGKGGVGKSTTAVNLALALSAEGARVGLLDADIYGPSQPTMTATSGRPESTDGKTMEPKDQYGLQINSIGYMVSDEQAMIWRGPMASGALEQLIHQTNWRELDYLVVDMPPGTGDIALTLAQKVPLTGAVIVSTPQDIALIDAKKAVAMFDKVGVPILGLVENMAVHICSQCGHAEHIFGDGGARAYAQDKGLHFLGALPLKLDIRTAADSGTPTVVSAPLSAEADLYRSIARATSIQVALRAKDFSAKFPTISISKET